MLIDPWRDERDKRWRDDKGVVHETDGWNGAHSLMRCETSEAMPDLFAAQSLASTDAPTSCVTCLAAVNRGG